MFICNSKKILNNYYNSVFPWLKKCEKEFGFKLDGSGLTFNSSYTTGTVITVTGKLDSKINSKFEVLAFFVPSYSYSNGNYTNYMENGHVTARYDNINVTLPIQMAKPRQK